VATTKCYIRSAKSNTSSERQTMGIRGTFSLFPIKFSDSITKTKKQNASAFCASEKAGKVRWGSSPHGAIVLFDYSTLYSHDF